MEKHLKFVLSMVWEELQCGIFFTALVKELLGIVYGSLELGFLQYGHRKVPTGKVIGFIGDPKSMRVP